MTKCFKKNVDLSNAVENMISHYAAERTWNCDLEIAALKYSVYFAMISSCTQYGPLLIQLLFNQFWFQERYLDLRKDGCFTFKLGGSNMSVFVGNDAVIEDVHLSILLYTPDLRISNRSKQFNWHPAKTTTNTWWKSAN